MSVNDSINAGKLLHDLLCAPALSYICFSKVRQQYHIVSALVQRTVHSILEKLVQVSRLTETVYVLTLVILKIDRCGTERGLRCDSPHKGYPLIAGIKYLVWFEQKFTCFRIVEVRTDIPAVQLLGPDHKLGHSVIELVVADGSRIISHSIHYPRNIRALGNRTYRRTLDSVTCVNEQDIFVFLLHQCKSVIADIVINTAVNIVSIENDNIITLTSVFGIYGNLQRCQRHRKRCCTYNDFQKSFHFCSPVLL